MKNDLKPCEFRDICEKCHPEEEMERRREECSDKTCNRCAVYWAFMDGYYGMDED